MGILKKRAKKANGLVLELCQEGFSVVVWFCFFDEKIMVFTGWLPGVYVCKSVCGQVVFWSGENPDGMCCLR